MPIIAGVPLLICLLFSGAIHIVWRRRPEASHAWLWSLAFALIAAGWGLDILTLALTGGSPVPGVASGLCWLAAGLLFVHGLRQRARRIDRGPILLTIWATIAIASGLLADLLPFQDLLLRGGAPLLTGLGLTLAAVAVGPRLQDGRLSDWIASGLLLCFALGNVVLVYLWLADHATVMPATVPLGSAVVYVGFGLAAMLLLSEDLTIALERIARTDPLTGLWNRRAFNEAAPHLLQGLRRYSKFMPSAIAIADIDAFKSINDRFGHTVGDEVLVGFGRMLKSALRPGDLLARLGGEEFAILALGTDGAALLDRIEHLRQTISAKSDADGSLPLITASFGIAEILVETRDLRDAMERADAALFRAKEMGRNRTVLDQPAGETSAD